MGLLVGPSRDVISAEEKSFFYNLHDHNFCRLLHPNGQQDFSYKQAAQDFQTWLEMGYLAPDPEPSIYLYEIQYPMETDQKPRRRTGFISLLRLEDYDRRIVRPHERTFTQVKHQLLESISCYQANLSQIFTLYDDPRQEVVKILRTAASANPDTDFVDPEGISHSIWRISDPNVLREVAGKVQQKPFYIADGHHRYEACLDYRQRMRRQYPNAHPWTSFNFTLVYAVAIQDPGLTLLPAHRLIKKIVDFDLSAFLGRLKQNFEIEEMDLDVRQEPDLERLMRMMEDRVEEKTVFGFTCQGSEKSFLLILKPNALQEMDIHPAKEGLDVEVLSLAVFGRCLGLGTQERGNEGFFMFEPNYKKAAAKVSQGEAQLCFLVNPTRIEQVKAVADAGLFMPRKSSNFFPKVAAGLVLNPMDPDQLVQDLLPGAGFIGKGRQPPNPAIGA
jgi:uncharacterized protein (DUF1015 family)